MDLVNKRKPITMKELEEAIIILKGAVMIAYPAYHNLPSWEPVYLILEKKMDFIGNYPDCNWLDEKTTVLWWAKKELKSSKILSDFVGKNEKTKLIVKTSKKG